MTIRLECPTPSTVTMRRSASCNATPRKQVGTAKRPTVRVRQGQDRLLGAEAGRRSWANLVKQGSTESIFWNCALPLLSAITRILKERRTSRCWGEPAMRDALQGCRLQNRGICVVAQAPLWRAYQFAPALACTVTSASAAKQAIQLCDPPSPPHPRALRAARARENWHQRVVVVVGCQSARFGG